MTSHGVSRHSVTGRKTEEEKQKERQAIREYGELDSLIRRKKADHDLSKEALDKTSELLLKNAEYYTIWNFRRSILESQCSELPSSESNGYIQTIIQSDLDFLLPLLQKFPKCYWIWNHRLWLLQQATQRLPSITSLRFWEAELQLVGKLLSQDCRNFHGWGYRRVVVDSLDSLHINLMNEGYLDSSQSMTQSELDYTTKMIRTNLSNFSAWHNRSKLIERILDERAASDGQRKQMLSDELKLIHRALIDPYDQSLWFYHQYLMCSCDPDIALKTMAPNLSDTERLEYLDQEVAGILEILEDVNDCKWVYQALISYSLLGSQIRKRMDSKLQENIGKWLLELKRLDPLRIGRWNDLEKLDTFEDAQDTAHDSDISGPSKSTRSLTDRRPSNGSLTTPTATEAPSLPNRSSKDQSGSDLNFISSPTSPLDDDTPRKKITKSPLLTTHRLSTSSLDDVNLSNSKEEDGKQNRSSSEAIPPPLPSRTSPKHNTRLQGLSASLPSVPWGPPPVNKNLPPAPQNTTPAPRKLAGPFSWLSRVNTKENKTSSNSNANRRNTGTSVSTIVSSPDMFLGRHQENGDGDAGSLDSRGPLRNSLKDQFKLLRLQDEGEAFAADDQSSILSSHVKDSLSPALGNPALELREVSTSALQSSNPTSPVPTLNPNLAPGTVSGVSASAIDASAPVDWELWEQVVNNGPETLAGENAEKLNKAIKRGIPQTIRGVLWQVLADSRNPELEDVYRELAARGTEKDHGRYWSINSPATNGNSSGSSKERQSVTSSRSSMHSDNSTLATSSVHGITPSDKDPESVAKAQAVLELERKKKLKEESASLQKLEKQIRRDLGSRTSYSKYFMSQRNQEGLFNICKAYALYDAGVGYAQGMNFIVMPLLFNMDDGEAFTLLVKLMNKYGLRNMFIQDMPGLHLHLYQFERLLEDVQPALACHLYRRGVTPQLYATQWFLTLFAYRFPLQLVLRIYDLVLEEGLESTILRFGVAIMQRNAETLLSMNDMTALTNFVKEKLFDVYIDQQPSPSSILESGFFGSSGANDKEIYRADIMVDDACAVNLTPEMLKTYTSEWEDKTQTEKEQLAQLENYKHTTATQAVRIRSLEEHAEKSDTEHVQIASELVRIKVENEELKETNEALKVEVAELKLVVDTQPAELEEKLRTEMDRIMKRNIEVQNENRAMEEQMAEMEKDLVDAKMKWAEMSESHETLKQKWSDLRKAFDE
ncbi:GTPase-activating protein [Myotisia sp. PD_48]|nr:GTPase-activating protein [Myotisia sp. PD_48]